MSHIDDLRTIFRPREKGDWEERAQCVGKDPEIFFPYKRADEAFPKSICARCEVREECLDYAIAYDEPKGIWGGMNRAERLTEAVKRRRKK